MTLAVSSAGNSKEVCLKFETTYPSWKGPAYGLFSSSQRTVVVPIVSYMQFLTLPSSNEHRSFMWPRSSRVSIQIWSRNNFTITRPIFRSDLPFSVLDFIGNYFSFKHVGFACFLVSLSLQVKLFVVHVVSLRVRTRLVSDFLQCFVRVVIRSAGTFSSARFLGVFHRPCGAAAGPCAIQCWQLLQ